MLNPHLAHLSFQYSFLCVSQTIQGFVFSPLNCALTCFLVVITGGLFLILLTWRADIKLNCVYTQVPLADADKVLLKVSKRINS